jgi:hypothetical protein
MTKDFPVEAYNLAETHALGKPTRVYETDFKFQVKTVLVIGGFLLLLCLSMALCSTSFSFTPKNLELDGIMIGCAILGSIVGGAFLLIPRFRGRNVRVYVYTEGLIYLQEHSTTAIRWEQIERIQTGDQYCTVLLKDGANVNFYKYLDNLHALGKNLKRRRKKWSQESHSHAHIDDASQET